MNSLTESKSKSISEYENESHIVRKKRAMFIDKQSPKKNSKSIKELIDNDDETEDLDMYARYIR